MHRVLHANCFPPANVRADVLLTDETLVAASAAPDLRVITAEERIDAELAHTTSVAMYRAAFEWFRVGEEDPSMIAGISAGDLAGAEAAIAILMPAARGVLAMTAALDAGLEPSALTSVVPSGDGRYARLETLAADAAVATVQARLGTSIAIERIVSNDVRNAQLRDKYAFVRDPDFLVHTGTRRKTARAVGLGLTNAQARLRRRGRPALLVLEYNPSREFARIYASRRSRRWRLVCWPGRPRDLMAIARAGDEAIVPLTPDLPRQTTSGVGQRLRDRTEALSGAAISVAGIDLWSIVREPLFELAERYSQYAASRAEWIGRELDRHAVRAVLVPFDIPAHARLLVRVSQAMDIPTFVINDGFKSDDIQPEGMTADVALAWSTAMRDCYYSRRPSPAIVTGNPRSERVSRVVSRRREAHRVLVGGHTFSAIDLNSRRSDSERFLDEILDGVTAARGHVSAEVLMKLHPSDAPGYYRAVLDRHSQLRVELRNTGDVNELFDDFDIYVAPYSTSLLEAAAVGLSVIYYRVNAQKMGPPFSGDDFLARRTASTPLQLAALLADRDTLVASPPNGWIEHYLGPANGAVDRVLAAIEKHSCARHHIVCDS